MKPAANGCYFMCKSLPYFHLLYRSTFYAPVSKMHAGSFRVSVIHQTLTWTTGFLTCVRDCSCACVYTRGIGTPTSQHNVFDSGEKISQIVLVLLTQAGFDTSDLFGSYDLESDALPTEPPRIKLNCSLRIFFLYQYRNKG